MRTRIILALMAVAVLSCACVRTTSMSTLMADETVRLEIDGEKVFVYKSADCQLSYNAQRGEFRAMTDTMLDFFCLTLDTVPTRVGEKAVASMTWSSDMGERSRNEITLEAVRIKGDIIWLCDRSQHTAAVVRILE